MATCARSIPVSKQAPRAEVRAFRTLAWFAALLALCYAPLLGGLVRQWAADENMTHGFLVPFAAGYIVWQRRGLIGVGSRPNFWGLLVAACGAAQMLAGTIAGQLLLARTAFLVSLAGAVLFLGGTRAIRALAFPLFLLLFLFPIPAILYARITLPLQLFASNAGELVLNALGIPVLRDGNILELASRRLSVAEACSGIRSLVSLAFLALIYVRFFEPSRWIRCMVVFATVPSAIAVNALRVALTGVIGQYRADLAEGSLHLLASWVLFLVSSLLIVAFHRLVRPCRNFS